MHQLQNMTIRQVRIVRFQVTAAYNTPLLRISTTHAVTLIGISCLLGKVPTNLIHNLIIKQCLTGNFNYRQLFQNRSGITCVGRMDWTIQDYVTAFHILRSLNAYSIDHTAGDSKLVIIN